MTLERHFCRGFNAASGSFRLQRPADRTPSPRKQNRAAGIFHPDSHAEKGRRETASCAVILTGRRYEMLFWAVKERPQGCRRGDDGAGKTGRRGERGFTENQAIESGFATKSSPGNRLIRLYF